MKMPHTGRRGGWLASCARLTGVTVAAAGMVMASEQPPLEAADPLEPPVINGGVLENDGLGNMVIQRTITTLGDRFYDAFASHWRAQSVVARGVITIEERPWMTEGTEVLVRYQNQVVHRTRVWPRNPDPETTAEASVAIVSDIIARYQRPLGNGRNPQDGAKE